MIRFLLPLLILYGWATAALWFLLRGFWHTGRRGRSARGKFLIGVGSQQLLLVLMLGWVWLRQMELEQRDAARQRDLEDLQHAVVMDYTTVQAQLEAQTARITELMAIGALDKRVERLEHHGWQR